MAFIPGNKGRIILGDFALSAYTQKIDATANVPMLDATVLTSGGEEFIPGVKMATISVQGLLDNVGSGQHTQIGGAVGTVAEDAVSYAPTGFALGNPTLSCLAREGSYKVSSEPKSVVSWTLDMTADNLFEMGVSLADLAQVSSTTTGTGVDNAAGTTNGGAAYLHVTQYATFTNVVFKVQHSTDNSSWSDLATFTTVTAVGSQQVIVAPGTVNRYLRAVATVSGSGTITYAVAFARR